ncbi:hypothetical protein INT43_003212 [Umbelopsis isabellina]|uniref:SPT2-domain-containing protein n=1 Tax=Mortierella isabellina TaxID=91625 RepID=A0A8H7UCK7_MORIS|nr:hypothetical protein INT43_003212 [Umbelopsis isabellina]
MSDVQFEELLATATSLSKEQEQGLKQRADRARKEDDRKRKDEERRQKAKKEAQAAILKLREEEEKRRKAAFQKQKLLKEQREQEALRRQQQQLQYRRPATNGDRKPSGKHPVRQTFIPDKPKIVHQDLSFDEILKKAKEVPTDKKAASVQRKYQPPAPEPAARPKLQIKDPIRKQPASIGSSKPSSIYSSKYQHNGAAGIGGSAGSKPASVRDRIKNMALAPPQKLNMNKRDMRSVEEIQQDVRRKLGKPVPEERRPIEKDRPLERRPMRPAPPAAAARRPPLSSAGRPDASRPVARRRSPPRMPFRSNRPRPSRRYSDEDEYDEDLDGFIDDEDVEEEGNDYSEVISKMFRYDRKRYHDEMHSDDDMEAGAGDVLREEKRSTRLARQEDLLEEQREREELERARKRKLARMKQDQRP